MAEVGVGRPTARARARALVLESTEIISQNKKTWDKGKKTFLYVFFTPAHT
jgi:hypothetical protein